MSDRLPRSNSQSQLPNYGQGQSDNKKDVGKKKDGAPAQSDKNTGQGHSDKNKAAPQMKSKEEKKVKAPSESNSDDGGVEYGANFANIMFGGKQDERVEINTFERMFLGAKPSQAAQKFKNENESSSEDDVMPHQAKMPKSPRQQQSTAKEKNTNPKVPNLSLQNLGNAFKGLASDRKEMTISPRKTRRETTSTTTTTTSTGAPSWMPASPRAVSHPVQSSNPQASTPTMSTTATATATTTTTKNTNTTTTTTTLAKSIAKSMPSVEKTTTSTPRGFFDLLPEREKNKKIKGEKQKGFDLNTKFPGSAITQSDKKMTVRFPASMLTESARDTIGLALSGQTPTGDQLAELIICIESQGYTSQIDKGKVSTIYRGASTVGDFEVGGDDDQEKTKADINIVNLVQNELLTKHLDVKKIQQIVKKLATQYKDIAPQVPPELGELDPKTLRKNEFFANLIKPLTDLFFDELFGKEMKLSSSGFTPEFRNFLKGIDAGIVKWANAVGNVDQDLLIRLRKSALAGYINTRGIAPIVYATLLGKPIAATPSTASVQTEKEAEKFKSAKLDILNRYLATVINHQIDEFYFDIMSHTKDQGEGQEKKLRAYGKAHALMGKKTGFTSARSTKDFSAELTDPESPRKAENSRQQKKLERESQEQKNKRYGIRSKEISKFIKNSGIKSPDSNFLRYLRDYLSKEPRENYKKFLEAKAEYILVALDKYIKNNPNKLKNETNFVDSFRAELLAVAAQAKNTRLAEQKANSASVAQTINPTVTQTQTTQLAATTSLSPAQKNIANDEGGQGNDDLSVFSEELALEELAKSSLEESVSEESIDDEAIQGKPSDSSSSSETLAQEDLTKSPFDDSVAESPTAEEVRPNVPGNSAAALERIKQAGLMESPFDDGDSSSSQ